MASESLARMQGFFYLIQRHYCTLLSTLPQEEPENGVSLWCQVLGVESRRMRYQEILDACASALEILDSGDFSCLGILAKAIEWQEWQTRFSRVVLKAAIKANIQIVMNFEDFTMELIKMDFNGRC